MQSETPKLYTDLASWFHLMTAPEDYSDEARFIRETLSRFSRIPARHVLELGSGGGNNASHLKADFAMTLVDRAPGMIEASRAINPECEHIVGDMRSMRLGREFDAVFAQDAIMYMTTPEDLLRCFETARVHCRRGGAVMFLPDFVRETLVQGARHGGRDGNDRSLRYLEWTFDSNPRDTSYTVDFAFMLREGSQPLRIEHSHHVFGLFSREEWLGLLRKAGFEPNLVKDPNDREVFVGQVSA